MAHIENHLPHYINLVPSPYFSGLPERMWPECRYAPRSAEATVALLGMVRVGGHEVPVLQRRFTRLIQDEGIPHNPGVLKIVSQETVAAAHRSGRPIDDLAYPLGILRDHLGRVAGCRGFGMAVPTAPARLPEAALAAADIARVGDPETWVNTANYPLRLFGPNAIPPEGDLVDRARHSPILDMPVPSAPLDSSPHLTLDESRTAQFSAPVFSVRPNRGPNAIAHLPPAEERESLHFVHPIALRHAALLGQSLRFCVTSGGLLRDSRTGTVAGGTSVYVFDPDMLAGDGM